MVWKPVQEPEEEWEQEGSRDKVTTATTTAEGPESPAHAPRSPTADNPPLLDMADCIRTETVKKAHFVVQRPSQEVKKQQDWEQSPYEATARPAGCAYSLLASTVITSPACETQLSHALRLPYSLQHRREAEGRTNSHCHVDSSLDSSSEVRYCRSLCL